MISYMDAKRARVDLLDIVKLNDALDVQSENERRLMPGRDDE